MILALENMQMEKKTLNSEGTSDAHSAASRRGGGNRSLQLEDTEWGVKHLLFLLMLILTLSEKLSVTMMLPSCSIGK